MPKHNVGMTREGSRLPWGWRKAFELTCRAKRPAGTIACSSRCYWPRFWW